MCEYSSKKELEDDAGGSVWKCFVLVNGWWHKLQLRKRNNNNYYQCTEEVKWCGSSLKKKIIFYREKKLI